MPIIAHGKTPALNRWGAFQKQLPTKRELQLWFSSGGYNLAVITGHSGLVVVDWDNMKKYNTWLNGLSPSQKHLVLSTYQVITSRGVHLYFRTTTETRTMPRDGVDIKARGSYVLVPPSIHPSGHRYQAVGIIDDIKHIDSIDELLPPPATPSWGGRGVGEMDPFDAAMCKSAEKSDIMKIHLTWTFDDLLSGLPQHRGTRLIDCPFHADTHASLAVYSDHVHCFGCNWHGDVIDVYAALHKLSIAAAIKEMTP